MKLVIDIDEQTYDDVKKEYEALGDYEVIGEFEYAIANGILLEDIKAEIEEQRSLWNSKNGHYKAFSTCIDILDEYIKGE